MPRPRTFLTMLIAAVLAYGYGVVSHDKRWPPTPQVERAIRKAIWYVRAERGFNDTSDRREVACDSLPDDTPVWLTFGQSNAANDGDLDYETGRHVFNFNFFDGRCYEARDPLLGPTGERGSVWTRVADTLIERGRHSAVLIAPIAVGNTSVTGWSPEGVHFDRIVRAVAGLARVGRKPTQLLWHQGETDVAIDPVLYREHFTAMVAGIRDLGIDAPIYVAQASLCKNHGSAELRSAQRAVTALAGVLPGPNTDTLDRFVWRRDMCHFSAAGLAEHAMLWVKTLEGRPPE